MRDYLKQIYKKGFATTFYQKPISYIDKHIKNKTIKKIIKTIITIIYTLLILTFAGFVFYTKIK